MSETEDNTTNALENDNQSQPENQLDEQISPSDDQPKRGLDAFYDVPVQVSVVLGRALLPIHELMKIGRGAVIQLDRKIGEPVDVYVNNRLVARGEIVKKDNVLGVTMTEMVQSDASM